MLAVVVCVALAFVGYGLVLLRDAARRNGELIEQTAAILERLEFADERASERAVAAAEYQACLLLILPADRTPQLVQECLDAAQFPGSPPPLLGPRSSESPSDPVGPRGPAGESGPEGPEGPPGPTHDPEPQPTPRPTPTPCLLPQPACGGVSG